jgi:ribosomal protein L17
MAKSSAAAQLENFNQRLVRTEQILPTLATKDDLQRAIEPLATKAELLEMRDELRRHMDVQTEALRSDIRLLAEYVEHLASKIAEK